MVKATPRSLYPRERDLVPIVQEAGWAPGLVWTGSENTTPIGIRSPDRPSRNICSTKTNYKSLKSTGRVDTVVTRVRNVELCTGQIVNSLAFSYWNWDYIVKFVGDTLCLTITLLCASCLAFIWYLELAGCMPIMTSMDFVLLWNSEEEKGRWIWGYMNVSCRPTRGFICRTPLKL
jgi:hypothetical protein